MIVRAAIAATLILVAVRRHAGRLSAPAALPSACPPELLARQALPTLRAAVIASLWAPGKRCVVRAAYPEPGEAPVLMPETSRVQRASGHWARLSAAGYVFAETAADAARLPAPIVRLAHAEERQAA